MDKKEAEKVMDELLGWEDLPTRWLEPKIEEDLETGEFHITAIDPISRKRMVYNQATGVFDKEA